MSIEDGVFRRLWPFLQPLADDFHPLADFSVRRAIFYCNIRSSKRSEVKLLDAISVKGLKKSYGDIKAVGGIDLSVKEGQLFAFLGPRCLQLKNADESGSRRKYGKMAEDVNLRTVRNNLPKAA